MASNERSTGAGGTMSESAGRDPAGAERPAAQADDPAQARRTYWDEDLPDLVRAKAAKRLDWFARARQLYERVATNASLPEDDRRKGRQGQALCTYKDNDLPVEFRLRRALEVLATPEELETTTDQETLGLAGAIHKLLWRHETRREDLERSLAYYRRGHESRALAMENDGYTGINAAFVLDQLAALEEEVARGTRTTTEVALERRAEACRIRDTIVTEVGPHLEGSHANWWWYATVAEAEFGLAGHETEDEAACKLYESARKTIKEGIDRFPPPDWELRSTAEQLAALARIQGKLSTREFWDSPAANVIKELVGNENSRAVVESVHVGKVGLALSGGGFRASFYHLGVLAKLAELDVLRRVEVLSCVSGGSILGAHWYLAVRTLLQAKSDDGIHRDDYVALVQWLEREFLAGVEKNVRTRVAGSLPTNLRMIFTPEYSRTLRVGELYAKHLYAGVPEDGDEDGLQEWLAELEALKTGAEPRRRKRKKVEQRALSGLFVNPKGHDQEFKPRKHNWRRDYKVPDLILNTTALNTGHCWQFTASWMGEAPASVEGQVDGNNWLRRMYYKEAPEAHREVRLGDAVAASSCVPGLFEPLALKGLFPDRTVRLVDGGVHDNQGIVGLFDQDCQVLLVSDASGQMGSLPDPSPGLVGVPLRSNSILMNRVRTEQFKTLAARSKAGLVRGMMFIHTRAGLEAEPVDWVDCKEPASHDVLEHAPKPVVHPRVQALVSEIRTDLDSFSEVEAFALMTLGYRMTERAFSRPPDGSQPDSADGPLKDFPVDPSPDKPTWRFLAVEEDLHKEPEDTLVGRHLEVGKAAAFRSWRLLRPLQVLAVALGVLALGGTIWLAVTYWNTSFETSVGSDILGPILTVLGFAVVGALVGKWVVRITNLRSTFLRIGLGIGLAAVGWLVASLHLLVFDRLFLAAGRVGRVRNRSRRPR